MSYKFKYRNKEIEVPKNNEFISHNHSWGAITSKPSTFTPSSHNQDWGTITGKPSTFSPSNHHHAYPTWMGKQYASGGEWLGFYNALGGGTRKGWIGHDGSSDFHINNEASHNFYFNGYAGVLHASKLLLKYSNCYIDAANAASTNNIYINAQAGYVSVYSHGNALYYDGKYYDANWSRGYFFPSGSGVALGKNTASGRWYRMYAANACNVSSDRRMKDNIVYINEMSKLYNSNEENELERLFQQLKPSTFSMISDERKRLKIGFIAQDIADALNEIGIDEKDVDFLGHTYYTDKKTGEKKDEYSLCYEEFIALNTHMIQKLYKQLNTQQQEIENLKTEVNILKELNKKSL